MTTLPQGSKILVLGDLHIEEDSFNECVEIAEEAAGIGERAGCDTIVQLGDLCDKNKVNGWELDLLTFVVKHWEKKFKNVIIMSGNHDKSQKGMTILNYLKWLDIPLYEDEYIDKENNILFGHYFLDKSLGAFGKYKYTTEEVKNYKYVILGHQHDYQRITDNIYHLGSARYTSFGESEALKKKVAIIDGDKLDFFELTSTIPLFKVSSLEELDKLPKRAKVQYEFKSFKQLKEEIKVINEIKKTFFAFKKKNDFINTVAANSVEKESSKSVRQYIREFLESIKDNEVKNILEQEFEGELK